MGLGGCSQQGKGAPSLLRRIFNLCIMRQKVWHVSDNMIAT